MSVWTTNMYAEALLSALMDCTGAAIGNEGRVGVAYSGGLDSAVVARVAREFAEVSLYTCATKGSHDDASASQFALKEGLRTAIIHLDESALLSAMREASLALHTTNPTGIAYTVPVISVMKHSKESLVLLGNGADELFGGYAKYASMLDANGQMAADLEKMLNELRLLRSAAARFGKRLEAPFACSSIIELAGRLPHGSKIAGGTRKKILRDIAGLLDLPSTDRPKKAAQYSSGVLKEMRRLAKKDGKSLGEWTQAVCAHDGSTRPSQSN